MAKEFEQVDSIEMLSNLPEGQIDVSPIELYIPTSNTQSRIQKKQIKRATVLKLEKNVDPNLVELVKFKLETIENNARYYKYTEAFQDLVMLIAELEK